MTPDEGLAHLRRVLRVDADREALDALEAEVRRLRARDICDPGGAAREEIQPARRSDPRAEPDERPTPSVPIAAVPGGLVRRATRDVERARRASERAMRVVDEIARRELDGEDEKR